MAAVGFSPATRVFEAAGAGACLITDAWVGLELFLKRDEEVLVARDGAEVGGPCRGPDARARAAHRRGRARPRSGRAHLRAARRRGRRHPAGRGAPPSARAARGVSQPLSLVVLGPQPVLVLGQRPRHHLPGAAARPSRRAATTSCSSSGTCPGTRTHRDLADPDFCRLVFYDDLDGLERIATPIAAAPMR